MFRRKDILGKSIILHNRGDILNEAIDIVINIKKKKVIGLLTSTKKLVVIKSILMIGDDGIIVDSTDHIVDPSAYIDGENACSSVPFFPKPVIDVNGNRVGNLYDLVFQLKTGAINGFLISDSLWKDLIEGLSFIENDETIKLREEGLFISDQWVEKDYIKIGGLENIIGKE